MYRLKQVDYSSQKEKFTNENVNLFNIVLAKN